MVCNIERLKNVKAELENIDRLSGVVNAKDDSGYIEEIVLRHLTEHLDPRGRHQYERIQNKADARMIFRFVRDAVRPLQVAELQYALQLQDEVESSQTFNDHELLLEWRDMQKICCSLIEVDHRFETIGFIHRAVGELFRRQDMEAEFPDSNEQMAISCLKQLTVPELQAPHTNPAELYERVQQYPFLDYALDYWHIHFEKAMASGSIDKASLINKVLDFSKLLEGPNTAHIAGMEGQLKVVSVILNNYRTVCNLTNDQGLPPLHHAIGDERDQAPTGSLEWNDSLEGKDAREVTE
jgi:hypothetical protein